MAQALLEKMLFERGVFYVQVCSGGVAHYARDGMLPSLDARLVLQEEEIYLEAEDFKSVDLRRHRYLVAGADLILTMTEEQKRMLQAFPEAQGIPLFTLREFAGEEGDIEDPAGQGEEIFRARMLEIKACLERSMDRLLAFWNHGSVSKSSR